MTYEPFIVEQNEGGDYVWYGYPRVAIGWLGGRTPEEWWGYVAGDLPIETAQVVLNVLHLLHETDQAYILDQIKTSGAWGEFARDRVAKRVTELRSELDHLYNRTEEVESALYPLQGVFQR